MVKMCTNIHGCYHHICVTSAGRWGTYWAACYVTVLIRYRWWSPPARSVWNSRFSGSRRAAGGWNTAGVQPARVPAAGGSERQAGDLWPLPSTQRSPVQRHLDPTHAGGHPERVFHSFRAGEAVWWLTDYVRKTSNNNLYQKPQSPHDDT